MKQAEGKGHYKQIYVKCKTTTHNILQNNSAMHQTSLTDIICLCETIRKLHFLQISKMRRGNYRPRGLLFTQRNAKCMVQIGRPVMRES